MITDDERREMANELRRHAAYSSGSLGEWWQRLQEIVTGEIDFANPQETYRAIADLIDRPTCHMVDAGDEFELNVRCDRCGAKNEIRGYRPYRYCPDCEAEVVEDD